MDVENKNCQVCKRELKSTDEIVVCPECGAPYHRECYLNQGDCVYKDKHNAGFIWKQDNKKDEKSSDKKICARCGTENSKDAITCSLCGYSDFEHAHKVNYGSNANRGYDNNGELPPLFNDFGFSGGKILTNMDLLGGVDPNEKIDDVLAADVASCVKINTIYYMPKFKKMFKEKSKLSLNWAALLLGPYWYFFRKNYLQGICCFLITLSLYFVELFEMKVIYENLNISSDLWFTSQGSYVLMDKLQKEGNLEKVLPFMLIYIAVFILLILNKVIWGVLGNYIYRKNIVSRIKSVEEKVSEEKLSIQEKLDLLEKKSGVNVFLPVLAYMILQSVSLFI